MSEAQLSALIGEIYDCAVDPAGWRPTLGKVAGFVGGDFCLLISEDAISSRRTCISPRATRRNG